MWVLSLGREGPLEEGMVTHSSVRAWTTLWNEEPGSPWGCKESDTHARTMLPHIFCCSDGSSLDRWGLLHLAPMSTWILLLFLLLPPAPAPLLFLLLLPLLLTPLSCFWAPEGVPGSS